jgi:hypothetical protein
MSVGSLVARLYLMGMYLWPTLVHRKHNSTKRQFPYDSDTDMPKKVTERPWHYQNTNGQLIYQWTNRQSCWWDMLQCAGGGGGTESRCLPHKPFFQSQYEFMGLVAWNSILWEGCRMCWGDGQPGVIELLRHSYMESAVILRRMRKWQEGMCPREAAGVACDTEGLP